ncbi:MAG: helix-turn-helix transcriptional regulator [Clostridia bacterium]|nr:helix-turn-helix transcriptional regulator [Clostridia bacterium]
MILSEKLKNARISRKISQKTLADTIGVSRATLSAWENGETIPPVQHLRKYQELFDFKKGYFDEEKQPEKTAENMVFDTSALNKDGIAALEEFYKTLISEKEYLKKP